MLEIAGTGIAAEAMEVLPGKVGGFLLVCYLLLRGNSSAK